MSLSSSVLSVVLVALVGSAAVAQPGVRERKARQVLLDAEAPSALLPLRVAAREVTTVTFDAPIVPESVDRAALAPFFSRVGVHEDVLVLKGAVDIPPGRGPVLSVRFAGPDAPQRVGFVLATVEAEVDSLVEVSRRGRSARELGEELADLRARCAVTEAGLAVLRSHCALSGLGGAVLTGAVTPSGLLVDHLLKPFVSPGLRAQGPHVLYRAETSRVLATVLINPADSRPWSPGLALVTARAADGRVLDTQERPLLMREQRLEPGTRAPVVLEWWLPSEMPPGTRFTLELWDREHERSVRWEQVAP